MSDSPDDKRLEELREQKKEQLRERAQQNEGEEAPREQAEAQKEALLKKTLTDDARQRLNAVRMSKPEFAQQVEQQIVALARSGRVQDRIDGDRMRELLKKLKPDSTDFNIRRR